MPQTCDVFTLLQRSCRDVQGIALEMLHLEQINVSRVETFLDYLERAARYLVTGGYYDLERADLTPIAATELYTP
jgi:hypothetical protein